MIKRKIIRIDEEKCNGCGLCIPNCAEGALKIIDGKARLASDTLCDGLGACLGHCPQGAITIEERVAAEFDEHAVSHHKHETGACPGSKVLKIQRHHEAANHSHDNESRLSNWPVQIKLVPSSAPYFKDADLLIAADCVPFAYAGFHNELLKEKVLLVGCPKLDDIEAYKKKISEIIKNNSVKSVTHVHMEVPCCFGLVTAIKEAITNSGKLIPFNEVVISIRGEKKL